MTPSTKKLTDNIFNIPDGIPNINYKLIANTYSEYVAIFVFLQNYKEFEKEAILLINKVTNKIKVSESAEITQTTETTNQNVLESPENNNEYSRLVPPYSTPCSYSNSGCIKKAAFQNTQNGGYYCWFHINCQNNNE
jgi:hypothetical protein